MAIHWHWAWGNETPTVLAANAGFQFDNVASAGESATSPYTYTGSPTRYSMTLNGTINRGMTLPAAAAPPGGVGACAIAVRNSLGANWTVSGTRMIEAQSIDPADVSSIYIQFASGSVALYVDNTLKETTASYDWSEWRYVALKWDMSTTTWSGQIFIDGAAATSLQTDPASVSTAVQIRIEGGTNTGLETFCGQIITYTSASDSAEVQAYVTRVEANADGTNIGTWVPSLAGTDFSELDSPINPALYTEEASPAASDRVEILTNGAASDLDTALGAVSETIESVCVHQISRGQNATVRAICGDSTGGTETSGGTVAVSSNISGYSVVVANLRPTGAVEWVGTDAPELILEVVSIT